MAQQLRRIGLWVCAVGLLASCTSGSATPRITPGSAGANSALSGLRMFDDDGLVFAYPAAWREFHNTLASSFSNSIADLATVDVPEPCTTTPDSVGTRIDCEDRFHLIADSLVVHVMSNGFPGFEVLRKPADASALTVDGLPAYMEELAPDDPAVGADVSLLWTLSRPGLVDNFYTIQALIRGPDLGPMKDQLRALIASLRYNPPFVPLPRATGAPGAAP